jgi:hypothetical protein
MSAIHVAPGRIGRRSLLTATAGLLLAAHLPARAQGPLLEVWKDPDCGCCKEWVTHLESNGFRVKVNDTGNGAMRKRLGVADKYGSCHTALVGGYAVEGHVPAREITRLLKEKPEAIGLSVAGMPVGSPGMDGKIYRGRRDPFEVLLLTRDGASRVYQRYEGKAA